MKAGKAKKLLAGVLCGALLYIKDTVFSDGTTEQ